MKIVDNLLVLPICAAGSRSALGVTFLDIKLQTLSKGPVRESEISVHFGELLLKTSDFAFLRYGVD